MHLLLYILDWGFKEKLFAVQYRKQEAGFI